MTRPIWFLDVDGVVNALEPREGLVVATARTSREWPIHYSPEVVGLINACHRSGLAEVRWLTTWEQDAQRSLAPAVGLDDFAAYDIPDDGPTSGWWKADVVAQVVATEGRPFVWTDDDLVFEDVGPALRGLEVDRLLVAPAPDLGLTSLDLRRVVDFLGAFASPRPAVGSS